MSRSFHVTPKVQEWASLLSLWNVANSQGVLETLTGREGSRDMSIYNWMVCSLVKTDSGTMSFSWTVHWINVSRDNVVHRGNHQDHHCHRHLWQQQNPASESSSRFEDGISGRQQHLHYRCEIASYVIKLALSCLGRKRRKKILSSPALNIQTSSRTFRRFNLLCRCFRNLLYSSACLCLAVWPFVLQVD